eukprot:1141274-Pelagomonas_calceolata.AAC.3
MVAPAGETHHRQGRHGGFVSRPVMVSWKTAFLPMACQDKVKIKATQSLPTFSHLPPSFQTLVATLQVALSGHALDSHARLGTLE